MDADGNPSAEVSHTINVDTTVPDMPMVCLFGSSTCFDGSNTINAADRAAGVTVSGTRADVATDSLIICINDSDAGAGINCSGGDSYDPDINGGDWSLALSEAQLTPYGEGDFTVNAIAIDLAGNRSISGDTQFIVDTIPPAAPTITMPVTEDNIINIAERNASVALSGSLTAETGVTAVLCFSGGSGDSCTGGTLRDTVVNGAVWSYTLSTADINAMGQGDETLTITVIDAVGNPSTEISHTISVDTVSPIFPVSSTADMREMIFAATGSSADTDIYNAEATDNGRAADIGIAYTLGGPDAAVFNLNRDSGVLTSRAQLSDVPTTYNVNIVATDEAGNLSTQFLTVAIVNVGISIHDAMVSGNEISMVTIDNENAGTSMFYVQLLSAPATGGRVVIEVVSSDTGEGTVDPSMLIFSDTTWEARQAVTVTAADDNTDSEDSFTVNFAISTGDGGLYRSGLNLPSVAVTVTNDNTALFFRLKVFLEGAQ